MLKKQVCPTGKLVSSSFLSILNLKLVNPPCGALKLPVMKNKNCDFISSGQPSTTSQNI